MKTISLKLLASLLALFTSVAIAQTDIRPEPGGKRLLFVDGDDIRPEPGGKRLLFIDSGELRPEPGGKRLLLVDSDGDVRHTPGGLRLALWDDNTLRRSPGGKILLAIDGDDIRTASGARMYFLDGPKLNRAQITAVLYTLKPDLFVLPPEETARLQKEMADAGAAEDAKAAADPWVGDHEIAGQNTDQTTKRKGSIAVTKQGEYYGITYKTGDNPAWTGVGIKVNVIEGGENELWAAVAPAGTVSLGLYDIKGGALSGTWIPTNGGLDPKVLGFEKLAGAPELGGVYKITGGKLPNGGAEYTGALNIDALPASFSQNTKCYRIRWATGSTATGFRLKDKLAVAAGWGADWEVLRFRLDNSSMGVELLNKSGAQGDYTIFR